MSVIRIPANLKALRRARKMKQREVADAIGVAQQTYSHYEKGDRTPSPDTLLTLAELYGVGIDDLYYMDLSMAARSKASSRKYQQGSAGDYVQETGAYVSYVNQPEQAKKFGPLDRYERELIYLFDQLEDEEDRMEVIEYVRFKMRRQKE